MRRRIWIIAVFLVTATTLAFVSAGRTQERRPVEEARDRLTAEIGRIVEEAAWVAHRASEPRVGIHVADLATGETVYERDADGSYNPASNAKLFVALAALRELGAAHTVATELSGFPRGDTLEGDIVLLGRGDPTLTGEALWGMAREVRARGIVRVTGGIVVDDTYFDDERLPYAFDSQPDEDAAFRAPVGAASVDANAVIVYIGPGAQPGAPAVVAAYPTGFLDIDNEASTVAGARNTLRLYARTAERNRTAARVWGCIGVDGAFAGYSRRIDDPVLFAGMALREALEAAGVDVEGDEIRAGVAPDGASVMAARDSQPLGVWLRRLGKDSSNFHAEQLLKMLGAERQTPGTTEGGARVVLETLEEMGVDVEPLVLRNGSGLFDADRASPRTITAALVAAFHDARIRPEFLSHLAVAGVDGTLRSRLRDPATRGLVRGKTGTLAAVSAFSGYVLAPDGRSGYAFSILVNEARGKISAARNLQDAVVTALARDLTR